MTLAEPVVPLEQPENRSIVGSMQQVEARALRKVGLIFNKLTTENFDSVSDNIIDLVNKSGSASTLMWMTKLITEKAEDEADISEMYARLCRKMAERLSPNVQDEAIRDSKGQPTTGGLLFRKYLLNRCQEDFERGWSAKEAATAQATNQANGEAVLHSEEYYAAAKAKRRGLGLVRFIGELFKQRMLTERIMHECIKKLLSNVVNPEEEEIESLCELLATAGQSLDNVKARNHMDIYFERMQEMARGNNINSRTRLMLQNVIELRERRWQARPAVVQPSTIPGAYEQAKRDEAASRNAIQRGRYPRVEHRGDHGQQADGWNVAGGVGAARPPAKAADISQFEKISKPAGLSFGPKSVFNRPKIPAARGTTSAHNPSLNLESDNVLPIEGGRTRKRLILLPRTKPVEDEAGQGRDEETFRPGGSSGPTNVASPQSGRKFPPLTSMRIVEDLNAVSYPEGIIAPIPGKFVYDRDFLLQFMNVCKGEPDWITRPDALGLEPHDPGETSSNLGGRRRGRTPKIQRQEPTRPGIGNQLSSKKGFSMGSFQAPPFRIGDSRPRPQASTTTPRAGVDIPPQPGATGRPMPVTQSEGRVAVNESKRTSEHWNDHMDRMRGSGLQTPANKTIPSLESGRRLEQNEGQPISGGVQLTPQQVDGRPLVGREVRSLLDKLGADNFDSISDRILEWANESEQEKNEATLTLIINLIFEKAEDKAEFSGMYARLCRKMIERVWPNFQDDARRNAEGQPITGGYLFYEHLSKRCGESFKHRWSAKMAALWSGDDHATAKAKREALSRVRFVGELLDLQTVPGRFIHEYAKKLLLDVVNPEEEEIESFCELLRTAGHALDNLGAQNSVGFYFGYIKEMSRRSDINPNIQLMLQVTYSRKMTPSAYIDIAPTSGSHRTPPARLATPLDCSPATDTPRHIRAEKRVENKSTNCSRNT
ncbi:hypothetical protein FRC10_009339 [Ceratobasidium sp. 414]|nr:hypothetical protein FRC10_009339 [Ceratobasidium sp. 414]